MEIHCKNQHPRLIMPHHWVIIVSEELNREYIPMIQAKAILFCTKSVCTRSRIEDVFDDFTRVCIFSKYGEYESPFTTYRMNKKTFAIAVR